MLRAFPVFRLRPKSPIAKKGSNNDETQHFPVAVALLSGLAIQSAQAATDEPIQVIRPPQNINLGMVELGKKLYFDPRVSKSGFISCNSCHNLSMGGSDNLPTSIGDKWQQGPINAPTVLNSSLNVAQFWDGRAADLKEQGGGPIANPGEMAFSHTLAEAVDIMGRLQLGRKFTEEENAQIVAFLETLTGDQPSFTLPILPPSSDSTPRPQPFGN